MRESAPFERAKEDDAEGALASGDRLKVWPGP